MVSTFDGVSVKCWLVKIHDSNSYTVPNRFAAGDGRFFFRTCHPSSVTHTHGATLPTPSPISPTNNEIVASCLHALS